LRFEIGNFIEVTDDFREFQGLTGHLAQITAIDEANRILDFAPAIPAAMNFNPADPTRHTRVRRWDQTIGVDPNGLLDVVAGPIDIEDGIQVTFNLSPATDNFKVGDFWVFAARTADGSVELLQEAPPRGILHHFCRLGFINWGTNIDTTTFTDCRDHWPRPCECDYCTVTVGDGVDSHGQFTDIQQAINALGNRGGVVCIARGFYTVTAGLVLNNTKHNVIIRGMGPATRILFAPTNAVDVFMRIERTEQVRLENVFVVSRNAEAMVRIIESNFVRIEDCYLINIAARGQDRAPRGIDFAGTCSNCEIVRSGLIAAKAISSTSGEVRQLAVRRNEILAVQISIFLREAFDLEVVENRMRGLPREAFGAQIEITRATIDSFQISVWNLFRATSTPGDFQAAGVLVFTANRIVISRNLINAHVAVLGFLFINARIRENDIVSLIGMLLIFGLLVKFEDNFVLGLFAGIIHAGIAADLDCTSNEFLGINGIIWTSAAEVAAAFNPLITAAITSVGLASTGVIDNINGTGKTLAGNLQAFGVVATAKVHRNVFLTFSRGIFKTDSVLSADISIIDNSFFLCRNVGIELGDGGRGKFAQLQTLLRFISLRHLIQSNGLAVQGRGIVSDCAFSQVDQNSVQCPSIAIELDGAFSVARNNTLIGSRTGSDVITAPPDEGLLIVHGGARDAVISGNRILNSPGHSMLIRDDLFNVTIEDNDIEDARRFGIGTFSEITFVNRASISRNKVHNCRGEAPLTTGGPAPVPQTGGAVVIGASEDVRFIDNVVTNNSPVVQGNQVPPWFAVFFEDSNRLEISGNKIAENFTAQGASGGGGAIFLSRVRNEIRLQNNVVSGNGGRALLIGEGPALTQMALVQNNHFTAGQNSAGLFVFIISVDTLSFQGNQCMTGGSPPFPNVGVALIATRANVAGNMVNLSGFAPLIIQASDALVNGNSVRAGERALRVLGAPTPSGTVHVIVTSNLTTGMLVSSTGSLTRANNFPAP
jgi:hypothetical protein